jgi:hypothetical protein
MALLGCDEVVPADLAPLAVVAAVVREMAFTGADNIVVEGV